MRFRWTMIVLAVALLLGVWWMAAYEPTLPQTSDVGAAAQTPSASSPVDSALPHAAASSERAAVETGSNAGAIDRERAMPEAVAAVRDDAGEDRGSCVRRELSRYADHSEQVSVQADASVRSGR